jgi:hypothetical protein
MGDILMAMQHIQPHCQAVQEDDGSWSVVEIKTGLAVLLEGDPMVLLGERFAKAFAAFISLEAGWKQPPTVH